ncbi:MAG: HAD family hydrolase [Candidatus Micrarchaeia archaeon]
MKGVLLDMEGVIRDSKNAFHHAYEKALEAVGLKLNSYPAATWKLRGFAELNHQDEFLKALYAIAKNGEDITRILWKKYPVEYVKELMKKTPISKEDFEKMHYAYNKTLTDPKVFRRIPPVRAGKKGAKLLKDYGFTLGIVTNAKREYNQIWMQDREVIDMFETVITSEDASQPKPSPEMILKACKKLGLKPSETYYLGDSEADIMAAKAAGCIPIGIMSGSTERAVLKKLGAKEVYKSVTEFALKFKR